MHTIAMALGFGGGLAVLASFAGVALGRLRSDAPTYHAMNLGGALALVVSGFAVQAWPSVAVNVVWAMISAAGLSRQWWSRPASMRTGTERRFPTAVHDTV